MGLNIHLSVTNFHDLRLGWACATNVNNHKIKSWCVDLLHGHQHGTYTLQIPTLCAFDIKKKIKKHLKPTLRQKILLSLLYKVPNIPKASIHDTLQSIAVINNKRGGMQIYTNLMQSESDDVEKHYINRHMRHENWRCSQMPQGPPPRNSHKIWQHMEDHQVPIHSTFNQQKVWKRKLA